MHDYVYMYIYTYIYTLKFCLYFVYARIESMKPIGGNNGTLNLQGRYVITYDLLYSPLYLYRNIYTCIGNQ